jgi:zinc transport system substrate-binding protein
MTKSRFLILPLMVSVLLIASGRIASPAELRVVTSIKPVHSLVASVMAGVGEPYLLVKGASSPHNFSLRPTDARKLSKADVVFWISKEIEIFLPKPLKTLATSALVVELSKTPGLKLLAARQEGDGQSRSKTPSSVNGAIDPHFWLDPDNAKLMVDEIVRKLSWADKSHAARFAANGAALKLELDALTAELSVKLAPIKSMPYIVFHDGYQYFEKRFRLKAIAAITPSPERAPGARKINKIRAKIMSEKVVCVFTEPQFQPAIVKTIIDNTKARLATLDPLGADIPDGPAAYTTLLRSLAASLVSCLNGEKISR